MRVYLSATLAILQVAAVQSSVEVKHIQKFSICLTKEDYLRMDCVPTCSSVPYFCSFLENGMLIGSTDPGRLPHPSYKLRSNLTVAADGSCRLTVTEQLGLANKTYFCSLQIKKKLKKVNRHKDAQRRTGTSNITLNNGTLPRCSGPSAPHALLQELMLLVLLSTHVAAELL